MCLPAAAMASTCARCLVCGVARITAWIDLSASTSLREVPSTILCSAAKSRTVSGSSVTPRTKRNGAPKSCADFTSVLPHQPRPTIAVFNICECLRLCCRRRAGLLERMSARECVDLCAIRGDAGEGRKWREIDFEEIGACRLAGDADIGHRDLLAVTISSGLLRAREILFKRGQSELVPVLRPFDDACFIDLEFMREIFAHPRHDQRVGIAGDDLRKAAHTRAPAWITRQQRRIGMRLVEIFNDGQGFEKNGPIAV